MKYIKLFENFNLNEELRSASYYNFSKFLEREVVEESNRTKNLEVADIKNIVVDSIIEFYDIEDNDKNRDKVNKSFVVKSKPLDNPSFWEVIVRKYYILDKDSKKDWRMSDDFDNNVNFIEIVDNEKWKRNYHRLEELMKNPPKFSIYSTEYSKNVWQKLKQGWKGQVHQKGMNLLIKKLYVYFPEEIKNKEENKDIGFFTKIENNFSNEDAKKLYNIDFTILTLEKKFKEFLLEDLDDDKYSQIEEVDIENFLEKLKSHLEENLDTPFNTLDENRQTDYKYLSEYVTFIKNLSLENNIINKSDKIFNFLTEFSFKLPNI
jgi:hypothetical protein